MAGGLFSAWYFQHSWIMISIHSGQERGYWRSSLLSILARTCEESFKKVALDYNDQTNILKKSHLAFCNWVYHTLSRMSLNTCWACCQAALITKRCWEKQCKTFIPHGLKDRDRGTFALVSFHQMKTLQTFLMPRHQITTHRLHACTALDKITMVRSWKDHRYFHYHIAISTPSFSLCNNLYSSF